MKKSLIVFNASIILFVLVSCASIISGGSEDITFDSNPKGAQFYINEVKVGITPGKVKLNTDEEYDVSVELEGYFPYKTRITNSVNGWFFGNLLLGGIIGIAVDFVTGAVYKLDTTAVYAQLQKSDSGMIDAGQSNVYFFVTLEPDPSWEKVGQLDSKD